MTPNSKFIKSIVEKLLLGKDHRQPIITMINESFLQYALDFLKKVAQAKSDKQNITLDWYKQTFLNPELQSYNDIPIHSGINKKTITNIYNSATQEIILEASNIHYDSLQKSINDLIKSNQDINLTLNIKVKDVSVQLDINESLIVINSLAVKRSQLRGGMWSAIGKQVETPLMLTLCELYKVPKNNYKLGDKGKINDSNFNREVDFYLVQNKQEYKCEVKLIGRGNPESGDAAFARGTRILIANKLSQTNKKQLETAKIEWIELSSKFGFRKFGTILNKLDISHEAIKAERLTREELNRNFKSF